MRKIVPLLAVLMLYAALAAAQNKTVTGKVTDENGKPLEGVSVIDKNTQKGAITNAAGVFSLQIKAGTTLVFTEMGFGKKEVIVGTGNEVNVILTTVSAELSEVVVTSFGVRREKKALGYAVSTVNKEQLELRPEGDLARVLNGKVPGLNIIGSSGLSVSGPNIVV